MSRFADPLATEDIDLGPCGCPGTPHDRDTVTVRYQLGASGLARIGRASIDGAVRSDPMAEYRQTVLETVVSWNLLWLGAPDAEGERATVPVPITDDALQLCDIATLKAIAEQADNLIQSKGRLPNGSGAPSRASRRGSASPTRTSTRTPGTST